MGSLPPFAKFMVVGLANTMIGLGLAFVAWRTLGWGDVASNVLGYTVGLLWSFFWNRRWTFRSTRRWQEALVRFLLTCGVGYAANLAVLMVLRSLLGPAGFWPHVAGNVVYTLVVYVGSRRYVFSPRRPQPLAAPGR